MIQNHLKYISRVRTKLLLILSILVLYVSSTSIVGCCKDEEIVEVTPWDTCTNKFTKDLSSRLGMWWRVPESGRRRNPIGLNFRNDSLLDILESDSNWVKNIKYQLIPCNQFDYNQYWIPDQNPAIQYWENFNTYYIDSIKQIELVYYLNQWG